MLEAEASVNTLNRQVFWLSAPTGFRTAFPRRTYWIHRSGIKGSEAWPITAAAPQRTCTVFPFVSLPTILEEGRTCRYEFSIIVQTLKEMSIQSGFKYFSPGRALVGLRIYSRPVGRWPLPIKRKGVTDRCATGTTRNGKRLACQFDSGLNPQASRLRLRAFVRRINGCATCAAVSRSKRKKGPFWWKGNGAPIYFGGSITGSLDRVAGLTRYAPA